MKMGDSRVKIVALLGARMAHPGMVFIHMGPSEECNSCRLYRACMGNLEAGRRYMVLEVKEKQHNCKIHEDGVRVVKLVEPEIPAVVPTNLASKGVIIRFNPPRCIHWCKLRELCLPEGLKEGDRVKVVEVLGKPPVGCKMGRSIRLVKLKLWLGVG